MTWNWRPELGRYRDHAANAAETPPFISAACPFLRHQTKITRLFEVSSWEKRGLCEKTLRSCSRI
jgi:hypothetical protein